MNIRQRYEGRTYNPEDRYLTQADGPIYVLPQQSLVDFWDVWPDGVAEDAVIKWALEDQLPAGKTFLDIGANVGSWAIQFGRSGKTTKVHAWEPQSSTFHGLVAGIALNGLLDKVEYHRVALGSPNQVEQGDGYTTLHLLDGPTGTGGQSSLLEDAAPTGAGVPWTGTERVEIRTLDSYGFTEVGLIKLDAEGNELHILLGAQGTLEASDYPPIIFECWGAEWFKDRREALFLHLKSLGYEVFNLTGASVDDYIAVRPKSPKDDETLTEEESCPCGRGASVFDCRCEGAQDYRRTRHVGENFEGDR